MDVEWLSDEAIQTSLHYGQQQSDLLLGINSAGKLKLPLRLLALP